jgi:hypothetical protein
MSNRTWTNSILDLFAAVGVKDDQQLVFVSAFVALTAIGISTCFLLLASGDLEMTKVKNVFQSLTKCCSGKRNKSSTNNTNKFEGAKTKTADLCEDSEGIELSAVVLEPSLEGIMDDDTPILSRAMAAVISEQLPSVQKLSDWKFSFAPRQHGVSYSTFYKKLKDNGPSVMLIKTTTDDLFGAFCSHGWHISGAFYGNGETFVFSFGKVKDASEIDTKDKILKKFECWRSTDKTSAFMFSDKDTIAIGGGGKSGGSAAILIDGSFNKVSSAPTATFGNKKPIVDSGNTNYGTIRDLEVWTFAM